MTNREFYEMVTLFVNDSDFILNKNELGERLVAKATEEIAKLDARNAKRSSTPSKTQIANESIVKAIRDILTDEPMLASKIAELCEISTQKASALVKKVEGVQSVDVKVKGKGTQKGYFLA